MRAVDLTAARRLALLHGERLVGTVDPRLDRATGRLVVNAAHATPEAAGDRRIGSAVRTAVEELATFLGARDVAWPRRLQSGWSR